MHESSDNLTLLTVYLMQVELKETVVVKDDDKSLLHKSITGRFPVIETDDGKTVAENLSIARFLSKDHPSFQGATEEQSKLKNQWPHVVLIPFKLV